MEWITHIGTGVGSAAVTAAVIGSLVRVFVKLYVEKRVDLEFQKRLAQVQHELNKQLASFQTRVANISGRRVGAILETYRLLDTALADMRGITNPLQYVTRDHEIDEKTMDERACGAIGSLNACIRYVYGHCPLFDDDLFDDIDKLIKTLRRAFDLKTFGRQVSAKRGFWSKMDDEAWHKIDEEAGPLLDKINTRAKQLLKEPDVTEGPDKPSASTVGPSATGP